MHRKLVNGFFRNAGAMLRANGEIHVNHKNKAPFCHWNLEKLAAGNSLALIQRVDFKKEDYPGYQNKRGNGSMCDEPFPLKKSSTYIFRLVCHRGKNVSRETTSQGSMCMKSQQFQNSPTRLQLQPTSSDFNYAPRNHIMNHNPLPVGLPPGIPERNHYSRIVIGNLTCRMNCYDVPSSGPGRLSFNYDASHNVLGEMRHGLQRQKVEVPRAWNDLHYPDELELRCTSNLRSNLSVNYDASHNVLGEMRHGLQTQKVEVLRAWNGDLHHPDELELSRTSNLRSNSSFNYDASHKVLGEMRRGLQTQKVEVPRAWNGDLHHPDELELRRTSNLKSNLSFSYDASHNVLGEMRHGLQRQEVEVPRAWNGDLHYPDELELHRTSNLRSNLSFNYDASHNALGEMRHGPQWQKVEVPRAWNGDLHYLDEHELRRTSILRSNLSFNYDACHDVLGEMRHDLQRQKLEVPRAWNG